MSRGDSHNRAAQLVNDLQQILLFADREFHRPRNGASPPAAVDVPRNADTPASVAKPRRIHSIPGQPLAGWRDRMVRNAPWLLSQSLVALIAVEMARVSVTLIGGSLPVAPLPSVAMNAIAQERAAVDLQSIVAAQFFGVLAADSSSEDPAGAPRAAANLLLAGTVATDNPKTGLAIISDSGPAEVYKVGARVGGASLDSVYRDRVILSRNGRLETLVLPKPSPKTATGTPPDPAPGAVPIERHAQRRAVALNAPEEYSPAD